MKSVIIPLSLYGTVSEWSNGRVCKTLVRGFESRRCLKFTLTVDREIFLVPFKDLYLEYKFLFYNKKKEDGSAIPQNCGTRVRIPPVP